MPPPPSDPAPDDSCDSATYEDHTYWFCTSNHNWNEATELCQMAGGELVGIGDADEEAFVEAQAGDGEWVIGLNKKNGSGNSADGTWEWVDGTDLTAYANWGSSEPDDADCGVLNNGTWRDFSCSNDENWICEMPE